MSKKNKSPKKQLSFWKWSHVALPILTITGGLVYGIIILTTDSIWDLGNFFRSSWPFLIYFLALLIASIANITKVHGSKRVWAYLITTFSFSTLLFAEFFFRVSGGWSYLLG